MTKSNQTMGPSHGNLGNSVFIHSWVFIENLFYVPGTLLNTTGTGL